jgi:ribonucleoside-diphosphate reductase alpha chain
MTGEFFVINKHLVRDLVERGLWNEEMSRALIDAKGSVQEIESVPADLKEIYKTVWEIKQKVLVDMSADRGAFVCQS